MCGVRCAVCGVLCVSIANTYVSLSFSPSSRLLHLQLVQTAGTAASQASVGAQGVVDIDISLAPESMASQADTAALAQKWQVRVCCLLVYTRESIIHIQCIEL